MLRLLVYILFFIVAYKIVRELLADELPQKRAPRRPENPNIHHHHTSSQDSPAKFNDAETIDYEEIK
jgi:hypothetical protein